MSAGKNIGICPKNIWGYSRYPRITIMGYFSDIVVILSGYSQK
jgi:hypothetical protein